MESELKFTPMRFNDKEIDLLKEIYARVDRMHSSLQKSKEDFKLLKTELKPLNKVELLKPVTDLPVSVTSGKGNAPEDVVVEEKLNLPLRNIVEQVVSVQFQSSEAPILVSEKSMMEAVQVHVAVDRGKAQNKMGVFERDGEAKNASACLLQGQRVWEPGGLQLRIVQWGWLGKYLKHNEVLEFKPSKMKEMGSPSKLMELPIYEGWESLLESGETQEERSRADAVDELALDPGGAMCVAECEDELIINPDDQTVRVRAGVGYKVFAFDRVSSLEQESLESFKKLIEERIKGVKTVAHKVEESATDKGVVSSFLEDRLHGRLQQ